MINVDTLLGHLRQEPEAFAAVWEEETREHGRGALAFVPVPPGEQTEEDVHCEFWTLEEIRSKLRDLGVEDEFPLRWLLECEEHNGLPVIIVTPDRQPGFYNLCFHRLHRPAALD